MTDNRCSCGSSPSLQKESVCIDTYRVLDSCRDRDCFEDVRVYLTDFGQDIIESATNIRVKETCILWTNVTVDPIQFNRGFYQIMIRFYVKLTCEACVGGNRVQDFDGIAVADKKVVLYGSEGNVSIFKSNPAAGFCKHPEPMTTCSSNLPTAVVEVADPIVLSLKTAEFGNKCGCFCCPVDEIPEGVRCLVSGNLVDRRDSKRLFASLGFFSVVRIERPAQYVISAAEYSVPDKECVNAAEDDPCSFFRTMAFPVCEFNPPSLSDLINERNKKGCCSKENI